MLFIGEKINASIPKTREALLNKDEESIIDLSSRQAKAGANIIDVNVGTGEGTVEDEIETMQWVVQLIKDKVKCKLCIDSADPIVIRSGIEAGMDKVFMINSVKASQSNIDQVFPIVKEYEVAVIALAMDEKGIPGTMEERIKACQFIYDAALDYQIPVESLYFDSLSLPVFNDSNQGKNTLATLCELKNRFPNCKTVIGLSNISFNLPKRSLINTAMLHMAMYLNVDAIIGNPLDKRVMAAVKAANVVLGSDRFCKKYTRAYRNEELV